MLGRGRGRCRVGVACARTGCPLITWNKSRRSAGGVAMGPALPLAPRAAVIAPPRGSEDRGELCAAPGAPHCLQPPKSPLITPPVPPQSPPAPPIIPQSLPLPPITPHCPPRAPIPPPLSPITAPIPPSAPIAPPVPPTAPHYPPVPPLPPTAPPAPPPHSPMGSKHFNHKNRALSPQ